MIYGGDTVDGNNYRLENTFRFPDAVVRVHRPILTEEEEESRMEELKKATAAFLTAVYREREQKRKEDKRKNADESGQACQQAENCV